METLLAYATNVVHPAHGVLTIQIASVVGMVSIYMKSFVCSTAPEICGHIHITLPASTHVIYPIMTL
jgi:hypothetical protein